MSAWTIEAWCATQKPTDFSGLHASAQTFLNKLNLGTIHPFCKDTASYYVDGVPPQGPLLSHEHLDSTWDVALTAFYRICPPLLAMGELWLRLFAFLCTPLCMARLLWEVLTEVKSATSPGHTRTSTLLVSALALASCVVLTTDDLYRLEFGTHYGLNSLFLSAVLVGRLALLHRNRLLGMATVASVALTAYLLFDSAQGTFSIVHHSLPQFNEGLYYDKSSNFARQVKESWSESDRSYLPPKSTFWMPTGDSRTGLPFLFNFVESPSWTRVWLPVAEDDEVVALDIHFPHARHNPDQPMYLVLHGLNGGSQEEYVKDFTHRRQSMENATVVVMVARGLMDLPVRGMNLFHGARWTDVHAAAVALRRGLVGNQMLAGVGYSMGGIILPNYVARSGADCALDVAVSVSGGLDMRYETNFSRAQRLWQPILTQELRETFVVGKWGERTKKRLTVEQMKYMMRAYHISEIDETAVVVYNGFRNLDHYVSKRGPHWMLYHFHSSHDSLAVFRNVSSRRHPHRKPHRVSHSLWPYR